jgi:hypothetical protein
MTAAAREIVTRNLEASKRSGVVKMLNYYSDDDAEVCSACKEHHGKVIAVGGGGKLAAN